MLHGTCHDRGAGAFPDDSASSGFAFGYNVGSGTFGGTTPLMACWLIHATGALIAPGYYIMAASAIALGLCLRLRETRGVDVR